MFFTAKNRKKNLTFLFVALFLFSGVIFAFSDVHSAHALPFSTVTDRGDCVPFSKGFVDCWNSGGEISNGGDNIVVVGFKWLLYMVFVMFGLLASLALTIFEWAIKPENVTLFFGNPGVYESWKFVRDFFNLFFILVLLYIAFSVVFQIEKNFKKTILSLVLAALFVNFSYPVSRALIDMTNVPMYFFTNQMTARDGKSGTDIFGQTLTASHLEGVLLPQKGNSDISRLLMAIVFIFLFSVTLLVLSVMFMIRLVALVVLVIFSSVGFVASIIPGLKTYSGMWWDNFWKYAFFGPAAMLMLLIATRLFSALGDGSAIEKSMTAVASGTVVIEPTFISSMALFTIPIIMLWMAMGLAQKMSLAGAGYVVGKGKQFSLWAGGKASGYNALKRNYASYEATRKKRAEEKNKNNFGSRLGAGLNKKQDTIYGATGLPGSKAANQRVKDAENKEIYEKAEANKKNGVSDPELRVQLHSGDKIKAAAAAISLSELGAINSANDFSTALKALGNNTKEVTALIEKASGGAVGGLSGVQYGDVMNSAALSGNVNLQKKFESKVKKEGGAKAVVEYKVSQAPGGATPVNQQTAVNEVLLSMRSHKDVAASESLFADPTYGAHAVAYVKDRTKTTAEREQAIRKASAEDGTSVGGMIP